MRNKINLVNGNFITLENTCPNAEMISIDSGKIAGINAVNHNYDNIDLNGATVIPGFVDAHFHLGNLGKQTDALKLRDCRSAKVVSEKVLQKSNEVDKNEWIFGFGWNNTKWKPEELASKWVLEVGSGAGRFTEVLLEAGAKVVSFDMGLAVEANYLNNGGNDNLFLFQGNIYSMPVKDKFFDYVFCYGVLQHTPDPRKTIQCIYDKLKPGGKLSLDCYDKKWSFDPWHFPKFFWRPITTRMDLKCLYQLIEWYIPIWLPIDTFIRRIPIIGNYLSTLTTIPCWNYHFLGVSSEEKQKWAIMDTFDSMAAKYDQPLSLEVLKEMTKTHDHKELEVFYGSNGVVVNVTR